MIQRTRAAFLLIIVASVTVGAQGTLQATDPTLVRADSAWKSGDYERARLLYAQVFAKDSTASRAVFRLAQLDVSEDRSLSLYRKYVALEPDDPWGHMAEGDQLARMGRWEEGLVAYDGAKAVAPEERDVTIGRARLLDRAGRARDAAAELEAWTTRHASDGEAWDLLGRAYARSGRHRLASRAFEKAVRLNVQSARPRWNRELALSAPTVTPEVASLGDSDGNRTLRMGGSFDLMPVDGLRLGLLGHRHVISNAVDEINGLEFSGRMVTTPAPGIDFSLEAGGIQYAEPTTRGRPRTESWNAPRLSLRARARSPSNGPSVDLRFERAPFGFSPLLVQNRVTRTEGRAVAELPLGVMRVRGTGRAGRIAAADEAGNLRTSGEVALVLPRREGRLQPSVLYRVSGFQRPSSAGYFAPRRADAVEAGVYVESGDDGRLSIAADVGGGMQRVTEHGALPGPWGPVWRAWSEASLAIGPARAWFLELEAYDAPFALDAAASGSWRFLSVTTGLRWSVR